MKIINLDSKIELTPAQVSFAESVIIGGERHTYPIHYSNVSIIMNQIPIFLLAPESMPDENSIVDGWVDVRENHSENDEKEFKHELKPSTEWLGFYSHSNRIMGIETPSIGLCPERIIKCINTDEELCIAIAKVLIHEFAHAAMKDHPNANYTPRDEFYHWMEESMANVLTLEYFHRYNMEFRGRYHSKFEDKSARLREATTIITPFNFVKTFISQQPPNYLLGLDLFQYGFYDWKMWSRLKSNIQHKTNEKKEWLDYVKANVGYADPAILKQLFEALYK